ncbi:mannose-6-phosphate isomerase [Frankia sp. CpI1-P]|nr:mannose-6-phosphate isomerase [Frankia sp. CpI1-P]
MHPMPTFIESPTVVEAAGNLPKIIREYVGGVNTGTRSLSIAHMSSPGGWAEPGQRPEFDEYTIVLRGSVTVEHADGIIEVAAGQAVHTAAGEWVRYSTRGADGADYISVCLPAFLPETVHRDEGA